MTRGAMPLVVVLVTACGARSELSIDPDPEARRDAGGLVDAGPRDGGPRDGGRDAGPPARCLADCDCAGTMCIGDVVRYGDDLDPVPLRCGPLRSGLPPHGPCDTAPECDWALCAVAGTCVVPCIDDADCGGREICREIWARTSDRSLQTLQACVNAYDTGDGVAVSDETMLGVVRTTTRELVLPASPAYTAYVMSLSGPAEGWFASRLVARSSDTVLFDADAAPDAEAPLNTVALFTRTSTALIPNSPRSVASDTGYSLFATADRGADVLLRTFVRIDRGASIAVDVFTLYRGRYDQAELMDEIREAGSILGLGISRIRFHDIVGGLRERYSFIEDAGEGDLPELRELVQLSAGADGPAISLFLVQQLGFVALGHAGGIPGPPMHGTDGSGIGIAMELFDEPGLPPDLQPARTFAHEIGHQLGLFHTSELVGYVVEPLPDTGECRLDRDRDGDGMLMPAECDGAGADNLMFWAASGETVTPDQREIITHSGILE